MRLSLFITENLEPILIDWVAFARQQTPASSAMSDDALLDHGRLILQEIVTDMDTLQGEPQRQAKSEGNQPADPTGEPASRSHARQRADHGFEMEQMVAEYRALRATVLRQWAASTRQPDAEDLEDLTRFNEAIDQALTESLAMFMETVAKTRDLFLAVLGHDLRGPLGTISVSAELAARDMRKVPQCVPLIRRSVVQMKALLDDLLELTKRTLGSGLQVRASSFDLGDFVRDTVQEIEATSPSRTIELRLDGDLRGEWDARRLHQAVSNLVFNALKYGWPDAPVAVALDGTQPDEVLVAVENTGDAIAADLLPRLFDPLVRAGGDNAGGAVAELSGANLGLGLFVVREIATAHGGTVDVASQAGRTRFTLRLPRRATAGPR